MGVDPIDLMSSKTTWTTDKNIVWLKKIKSTSFCLNVETTTYWIDLGYETIKLSKSTRVNLQTQWLG
jgi:hypothetical protein